MPIIHLHANIDNLLTKDAEYLSEFFNGDGEQIILTLQKMKSDGFTKIPAEGCKYFDDEKGCQCRFHGDEFK